MGNMEPDTKYSRFMFHLKFSQTDEYLHEHELYEVMRSRNLYQTQFGVRSNFKKIMRNLYKDEKQTKYGFENTRKMFVQKMRERREQIDKLRQSTSNKLNSLSMLQENEKKTAERQYVPVPQATFVYTGLPPIETTAEEVNFIPLSSQNKTDKRDDATILPPAPSPSMVATVYADDRRSNKSNDNSKDHELPTERLFTSNVLVVGMTGPQTVAKKAIRQSKKALSDSETVKQMIENDDLGSQFYGLNIENKEQDDDNWNSETVFEQKTKLGEGEAQVSTACLTKHLPTHFALKKTKAMPSESKVQFWAEQHGKLESEDDIRKEADFHRLLIDRPSKWAVNPYHDGITQSKILDMRLQYSEKDNKRSFKRKSRQLDDLTQKHFFKQRLSLPELNTTPKPMVSLDPGGTTPDGRLILTKADYEDYLSDYKKARSLRLERSKKRNLILQRRIEEFILEPKLCLKDDTALRASFNTI
ncbi:uncharacterized protein LOC132714625 [Ruditapes philippinarum]|uniref:uncharacterized protein LOC132714625 n=1 Tax=Ruditapes philippinarum TaxID=129788 RepID=UPI00295A943A|nr:uncharacterized protein LOC132714625 [Ruditapes philippinarum]